MRKEISFYHLIVGTVFVGILLTGLVFYVTNTAIDGNNALYDCCYDGTVIEGDGFFSKFERAVYQNRSSLDSITEYQYRLFRIVSSSNAVAGKNDFLFPVRDSKNGYNFLEDYLGRAAFTEAEMASILGVLQKRQSAYAERGAEYLLVILPNTQTVYSENMPAYLGDIKTTRLDKLDAYLEEHGFTAYANLTDEMISYKAQSDQPLYNNTENTLNALGMYYAYRAVCDRFDDSIMASTRVIPQSDLNFYQHLTTGKTVAREAALEQVVPNLTVSLSNSTKLYYHSTDINARASTTVLVPFESHDIYKTPSLLLQFSDTWERLQAEPFFSNTFSRVTYQTDFSDDSEVYDQAQPRVVIQFLYENQLSWLLPQ